MMMDHLLGGQYLQMMRMPSNKFVRHVKWGTLAIYCYSGR